MGSLRNATGTRFFFRSGADADTDHAVVSAGGWTCDVCGLAVNGQTDGQGRAVLDGDSVRHADPDDLPQGPLTLTEQRTAAAWDFTRILVVIRTLDPASPWLAVIEHPIGAVQAAEVVEACSEALADILRPPSLPGRTREVLAPLRQFVFLYDRG